MRSSRNRCQVSDARIRETVRRGPDVAVQFDDDFVPVEPSSMFSAVQVFSSTRSRGGRGFLSSSPTLRATSSQQHRGARRLQPRWYFTYVNIQQNV